MTQHRTTSQLALSIALAMTSLWAVAAPAPAPAPESGFPVNTFIGTQDDGNTFPGASAPFGMLQLSPIGEHYAGWRYLDPKIRGFGHFFLSGAGCWEQGGQLSVLPVTGDIGPGARFDTTKPASFDQKKYASSYTHDGEVGTAGYFKIKLTDYDGIVAETTALTRAGAERYTFADTARQGHVLVNVGQANERHSVVGSTLQVVGDRAIEGKIVTKSFCGGAQYATWFRMEFDRPFSTHGVWSDAGGTSGTRGVSQQGDSRPHGAWFTFDLKDGKAVTAISAISHVDAEGARRNLHADAYAGTQPRSFDAMREASQRAWQKELNTVRIGGADKDQRTVFYTALYHALLQPLTGNDADGRYRGYDDALHNASGSTYYEFFSLWDTYRAHNQLLALLRPERARDIADSVLKTREQGGWLPRWGYANFESNVMTGDPVTPFLVDLWRFGALKGQEQRAYTALRENAFGTPPFGSRSEGRAGNPSYLENGYVQYDRAFRAKGMDVDPHHGGSATLEYAQADGALAYMAEALGKHDDAALLRKRAGNWHKVWDDAADDKELGFKGFPRARMTDGEWFAELDGSYSPRAEHGFHEGTAWQYQWLVQQDVGGMVAAMGGRAQTARRLDAFFAYDALRKNPYEAVRKDWVMGPYNYYSQYRYNPNNEPDLHAPWMYTLVGQPWKTSTVLRAAETLFTNAPNGVTGNDDLGTMSAWYVFSVLGLYPSMPGSGHFLLHAPKFASAEIDIGNGKTLRINSNAANGKAPMAIEQVRWNGQPRPQVWLDWEQLNAGGQIQMKLGSDAAAQTWGTQADALPADLREPQRP
ncbi:GH92 family glycosyl hydrolase [Duganella violaceipulchra]|uniref:Alpha-1,2-mannosidase n=1 Tax=Duganella violaceipulchra TaxID=2849652 RepID=A0AA41HE64_9BURK|nr:GH92 family glycosyl hydrolase [Duganella violaceicalia]MBV6324395.1 GH92 family glycosyl hydrolase [Duganella violaceicalia]MCP2011998.1 putative alpha-1,2-mannosidase [Duganella violaceicalia]